jgi:hypothetical protein
MHAQTSRSLSTQIELTKKEKARATELDSRLSETTKKYDDSKKAYFKSKDERERLRQEVDRYKSEGVKEQEVSASTEITHKYEQIKIKYRVSIFNPILINHYSKSKIRCRLLRSVSRS